jgi:hypothetical protein
MSLTSQVLFLELFILHGRIDLIKETVLKLMLDNILGSKKVPFLLHSSRKILKYFYKLRLWKGVHWFSESLGNYIKKSAKYCQALRLWGTLV